MEQAIRQAHDLMRPRQCSSCGTENNVKLFELTTDPSGHSHHVMAWCPTCARQVAYRLTRVFPDPMPEWITAMQNLGGKKNEHS